MRLAKTSSISAKFEILTCKNFSFHGNLNDQNNMAKDFQNSVEKNARANKRKLPRYGNSKECTKI